MLQEQLLSINQSVTPSKNVLDHASSFRERIHSVLQLAQQSLATSQSRMKGKYNKKSVQRSFKVGDQVLVLMPLPSPVSTPAAVTSVDVDENEYSPCMDGLRLGSACLSGAHFRTLKLL